MLDLNRAHAYEPDTEVTDDPDEPTPFVSAPIARSRTSTDGALTMQVYKLGVWHRRTPDLATTACGVPIHSAFDATRREELCLPLCPDCFTKYEHDRAAMRAAQENDHG